MDTRVNYSNGQLLNSVWPQKAWVGIRSLLITRLQTDWGEDGKEVAEAGPGKESDPIQV